MPNFEKVTIDNDLRVLYKKYNDAKDKIYQKGGSGYNMKKYRTGTSQYKQAKVLFDQEIKEFRKLKAELDPKIAKLETKLKELETKKTEEKETKTYKSTVEKLKDDIQRAKDAQDSKAQAAAEAKLKAEYDAKKAKTDKTDSKTNTQFQVSDSDMVGNELSKANVTLDGSGRPIVQYNFTDKDGKESVGNAYLYVTTTKGGTGEKAFFFGTSDVIRDRYQKQLIKQYGSKQAVIDKLYKAGYLETNKEVPTSVYLSALDSAAGEYTVAQVNAYKAEGLKEFPTMNEFLAARKNTGGLGGTRTRTNVTEYDETDLTKIINAIYQDSMGRDANSKELNKLIPIVNKQLKKNPDVISTTTDSKGNVTNTKTKTGINVEQFLIEEISGKDEAKAKQVLDYYNVFKQTLGVN